MALYVSTKDQGNPENDSKDGVDGHAHSCPTFLDSDINSRDSRALSVGDKRRAGQAEPEEDVSSPISNNDEAFAVASYNSAFFAGLFDDVASSNNDSKSVKPVLKSSSMDDAFLEPVKTIKSEHNLAKRRLVSTTQSLQERCGPSVSNLLSFMSSDGVSSRKMGSPTSATPMDLPVTVSTSLSFQRDQTKSTNLFTDQSLMAPDPATASATSSYKDEDPVTASSEGEFGWFVETDLDDGGDKYIADPYASLATPLAFSAPTAPRASQLFHQAEVEWAQAADTVDAVLGDLF